MDANEQQARKDIEQQKLEHKKVKDAIDGQITKTINEISTQVRKTNLIIDDLVRNKVDPVHQKMNEITDDCIIMRDKIEQLNSEVEK